MGRTLLVQDSLSVLCRIGSATNGHDDGAVSDSGHVWGTYLHGLFDNDLLRHTWLRHLGWRHEGDRFDRQRAYDQLADHVRSNLDMEALQQIVWDQEA